MPEQEKGHAIATRPPDETWDRYARFGKWLAAAEGAKNPDGVEGMAAAMRAVVVAEEGWPLRAAFEVSIIHGSPHISSRLLRALAERHGYRVIRAEETADSCTAAVLDKNTGEEIGRSTFTMDDAHRAGLVKERGAWQTYPARMLWARAAGWAVTDHIPHVALGFQVADDEPSFDIEAEAVEVEDDVADAGPPEPDPQPANATA